MADPVVHITAGVPDSGTGNITTLGQTLLDGANIAVGATTDAAVTAGATGTLSAKLRSISRDIVNAIVLATGTNVIGKVGIDQTTPGTTNAVQLTGATNNINNIAGTVSLPTGASTAAKQPALGTAGVSSTDVLSVQGIASGTALPISAASLPLPTSAATSTKQSDGSQKTQIVDGSGNVIASTSNAMNVAIVSGGGSGGTASSFAAAFPATGTAIGAKNGANMVNLTADASNNLNVAVNAALPVGTNVIGKTSIDQTTPGTTNLVALTAETTKVIGTARNVGNIGGVFDAVVAATYPANALAVGVLNGANIGRLVGDETSGLWVNIKAGSSSGAVAQGSTTSGQSGSLIQGAVTTGSPAYTTAQTSPLSLDTSGNLRVITSNSFTNITTSTTTTCKSGAGTLRSITINQAGTSASTAVVYDNTAGSGTKIGTLDTLSGSRTLTYDVSFATGLTIVTTGAPDLTISWR